jgi:hypothetical protein
LLPIYSLPTRIVTPLSKIISLKKVCSIVLLVTFCYNWFGYWLIFKCSQAHIKAMMQKNIQKENNFLPSELTLIKISIKDITKNTNFIWQEANKEFTYYHKWYDVGNSFTKNDTLFLYSIHDIDEEIFVNTFENNQEHHLSMQKAKLHKLLLTESYFICYHTLSFTFFLKKNTYFDNFIVKKYKFFLKIPFPPPQIIRMMVS